MSDRPRKRARRLSSEEGDSTDDWVTHAMDLNGRSGSIAQASSKPAAATVSSRTHRGASQEPQQTKRSIRLTVKAPPNRLQEITGDDSEAENSSGRASLNRGSKNKKPIIDPPTDDEEDEEEDEEEEEEEDEQGGDDEGSEEEGEEGDEDEDEVMQDAGDDEEEEASEEDEDAETPAPQTISKPSIKISVPTKPKPSPAQRLQQAGITSVEDKEVNMSSSEMSSEPEDDPPDLENMAQDDRGDVITASAINDSDLDSDSELDEAGNATKQKTRRQRAASPTSLMALSNEAQKKKFFTAEQITMRRAEMARRRKDLSEKRNEEEKTDTLKRLLEKPAVKRRSRAQVLADAEREEFGGGRGASADFGEGGEAKAKSIYVRTVIGLQGARVGVPEEWLGTRMGRIFEGAKKQAEGWPASSAPPMRRMVEVVE